MRKSRNGQVRAFAAITKFSVLLMCFATVFALVLTAGVFDIGGSDMNANVAEAGNWGPGGTAVGTTLKFGEETFSASSSTADYASFNRLIHNSTNSSSNSYELSLTFTGTDFSKSGMDFYTAGDTPKNYETGVDSFGGYNAGGVTVGIEWGGYSSAYVVANIEIPGLIKGLLGQGYTVQARWSAAVMAHDEYNGQLSVGIQAQGSALGAQQLDSNQTWLSSASSENHGYSERTRTSNTITVNQGSSVVSLCLYKAAQSGVARTTGAKARGITVTFIVTKGEDNSAPQVMSQPAPTGTNTSYLTQDNKGGLFNASGSVAGNIGTMTQTSIWDGTTINLDGVAVRKNAETIDGHKYAKSVTINLQDLGQNGVAASGTQANYYAGLAGLSFNGGAQTSTVYDGGQDTGSIGYGEGYYVWKVDAARDKGVLTLYFNDNVSNLKVRVYDSGGNSLEITVNVDGIKTGGDNMNSRGVSVTADEYMTDGNNGKWLWDSDYVLSPSFTNAGAGAYAQVWFYAVKRYDSLDAANGTAIGVSTTEGSTDSWQPIGYSTNDSGFRTVSGGLEFDISTGMLSDIPAVNGDGGNGSGYYRFEFYNMNYAGYVSSSPVVRVVKVDIDTPEPTTTLTYAKWRMSARTSPSR